MYGDVSRFVIAPFFFFFQHTDSPNVVEKQRATDEEVRTSLADAVMSAVRGGGKTGYTA